MLSLNFARQPGRPFRLLCLGAHSDDIEIGCGGLILSLIRSLDRVEVDWVVFSGIGKREREARSSATLFLKGAARTRVTVRRFRDGFFPYDPRVKATFESLKRRHPPDLVMTHYRDDRHQDHRTLSDLTWNTFRNHIVLEYEIPKWDGDLSQPNVFIPASKTLMERKAKLLFDHFGTQRSKDWFDAQTFMGLARLRGAECRAPDGFAEAFHARKIVVH